MNIGTLTDYRVDCKLYLQVGPFGSSADMVLVRCHVDSDQKN